MPVAIARRNPAPVMVATEVVVLVHEPPPAASVSVVVAPGQRVVVPPIVPAFGNGLTVKVAVAAVVPQLLVTV